MIIPFTVPGNPQALQRHRDIKNRAGQTVGHRDPSANDKADFLAKAMQHRPPRPIEGPIFLFVQAFFKRPKGHYRTGAYAGELKPNQPNYRIKTPDADNFLKFVGDALNGIFWADDKQIVMPLPVKRYADSPRVEIIIYSGMDFKPREILKELSEKFPEE